MPNYKVKIEVNLSKESTLGINAIDVYFRAPSILIAGNRVLEYLNQGISIGDEQVTRIIEIESKSEPLLDARHSCRYKMSEVPPMRFSCRNEHIKFRNETGIKSG